jgi:hypothetical protein
VVILITDDQRFDMVTGRFMPKVSRALIHADDPRFPNATTTIFANAFVPNPLCCPSRTSGRTPLHTPSSLSSLPLLSERGQSYADDVNARLLHRRIVWSTRLNAAHVPIRFSP